MNQISMTDLPHQTTNTIVTDTEIEDDIKVFAESALLQFGGSISKKLLQIKENGHEDEIKNIFKLMLYEYNLASTLRYYEKDKFCHKYSIDKDSIKYGCNNLDCPFSHSINLIDYIWKSVPNQYFRAKSLCLYLMYTKKYRKNAALYNHYASIIYSTIKKKEDCNYLKTQRIQLRSLHIDCTFGWALKNYAFMLNEFGNINLAQYYFEQAIKYDSNNPVINYNYGLFLIEQKKLYKLALKYCNKACQLAPKHIRSRYWKGIALGHLERYNDACDEFNIVLQLNEAKIKNNEYSMVDQFIQHVKKSILFMQDQIKDKEISNDVDNKDLKQEPQVKLPSEMRMEKMTSNKCNYHCNNEFTTSLTTFIQNMKCKDLNCSDTISQIVQYANKLCRDEIDNVIQSITETSTIQTELSSQCDSQSVTDKPCSIGTSSIKTGDTPLL